MIGPLPYIGGKNRLAKRIISMLPEHVTYVEPFPGGAQVLFHKPPSHVEVLNDLDYDIVNFFRVCQWHYQELIRYLRYCLSSRTLHELHVKSDPATLTDVQRAGRFFYLQKNSFGGLIVRQKFHYGVTQPSNYNLDRIPQIIEQAHRRLARVQIESLPYEEILKRYDRPTTVFYLDPPYWERKLYKFNFSHEDFKSLEGNLRKVKGKFLLSLDDREEVRQLFKNFHLKPVALAYSAKRDATVRHRELLITNFVSNRKVSVAS
ncbi:MAG TPA: DNA adenine methylase [Bryobacteraceae bacterium]|nr:DNA adenine methylase [Bryobacteraceae bacterium]